MNVILLVKGFSAGPLKIRLADSENYTGLPFRIAIQANETEIPSLNGTNVIDLTISTDSRLAPGNYVLLISVTAGSVNQAVYVWLQVTN
jgi:hypothetical protein